MTVDVDELKKEIKESVHLFKTIKIELIILIACTVIIFTYRVTRSTNTFITTCILLAIPLCAIGYMTIRHMMVNHLKGLLLKLQGTEVFDEIEEYIKDTKIISK